MTTFMKTYDSKSNCLTYGAKVRFGAMCLVLILLSCSCATQNDAGKDTQSTTTLSQAELDDELERKNEFLAYEHQATADEQARRLLAKFDLHPVGEPELVTDKKSLPNKSTDVIPDYFLEVHNAASKEIGLDMTEYRNDYLAQLTYLLEERSQENKGKILAHFLYDVTGEVRGAFLSIEFLMPGVVSLNDRYHFYPVGIEPEALRFSNIETMTIAGPFTEKGWQSTIIITDAQLIAKICRLIEKSQARKGGRPGAGPGEENYGIWLNYLSGPTVRIELYSSGGEEIVRLDTFPQWHYLPPRELKRELIRSLAK